MFVGKEEQGNPSLGKNLVDGPLAKVYPVEGVDAIYTAKNTGHTYSGKAWQIC